MSLLPKLRRRRILRGMMAGGAVTVGLPFLDCMLNANGTALAATGKALPEIFGTWFWGCGLTPGRWEPRTLGANYDILPEIEALAPFKDKLNIYSGLRLFADGKPHCPHVSGAIAVMTGNVPDFLGADYLPSLDTLIADKIGRGTRFRSLEVSATGSPRHSYSFRGGRVMNPAEPSPLALYRRIFGPEFVDPNAASFTPDINVMVRHSALSAVREQRDTITKYVGAADSARLDEYFTSIRQLEQQLALQLEKPAPARGCSKAAEPGNTLTGLELDEVNTNHRLFAKLLAHALACDQTRVFNVVYSDAVSGLRKAGDSSSHHILTHEEVVDPILGYQKRATWFLHEIMKGFAEFVKALGSMREGDATLLDRALIFATSEGGLAKLHSIENIPAFTVGSANGRIKTGIHVSQEGHPISRIGLTMQQAFGLPVSTWGTGSNQTSRAISEVLT
jgi:hypothetical protein